MSAEDVEQQIRRHPTANERFLLGLLDEARSQVANGMALAEKWVSRGDWIEGGSIISSAFAAAEFRRALRKES